MTSVKPNLYDSKLNVHFHGFLQTEVISAYTDGFSQPDQTGYKTLNTVSTEIFKPQVVPADTDWHMIYPKRAKSMNLDENAKKELKQEPEVGQNAMSMVIGRWSCPP
jgi:hypothetical protein